MIYAPWPTKKTTVAHYWAMAHRLKTPVLDEREPVHKTLNPITAYKPVKNLAQTKKIEHFKPANQFVCDSNKNFVQTFCQDHETHDRIKSLSKFLENLKNSMF